MTALTTGSEAWWQAKDGPERERHQENYRVTFWWRDPAGTQKTSTVKRVWLYVTGVTDHHQNARPQSLERIPDTDVWQWQGEFSPEWRGSYCFIPSDNENDFASAVFEGDQPDRMALREGWRKLLPHAVSDPLNAQSWRGGRGHAVSALEMPEAPVQPGWNHPDTPYKKPVCIEWHSARLKNRRRVWVFTTGDESPERPLAVLLDGQFWAESMPVWPALASLTHEGKLPPAVYVLIDVIDTAHRSRELPCNPDFWLAVQDELLPQVKSMAPFSDRADHTMVAGQSFGGLSSLYAGLNWPQRFGCILSQSGSYWWPHRGAQQDGLLIEQLKAGDKTARGLRIVLEAGRNESLILRANQAILAELHTQQPVFWRQVDGGHDALCWRGGLTQGLMTLWQPLIQ
ncbi:enterochelin esterase [Enterobacter hormaechei]|uniref:enterochelin esterase n=1 Tax=Enterobacter cloacae complex TaxID=354276 RepID=UPI0007B3999F|nr:enterochelin esterase [Enterobacter hormaechei]KZQ16536.1 enterochelin esterase [Enterobacter hormaechei subsp. steigerwaltii]MCL8104696.1 enterochelin esterase [Enterobacter hormaechei]MCM8307310.1 enterochelin esterase [Enterobacter hormaechei]MCM8368550.1 enterochelin esterase [Enterobacter hormaechei]MCM8372989.1 enterochelin esterase [Enterobacter hormaechei]